MERLKPLTPEREHLLGSQRLTRTQTINSMLLTHLTDITTFSLCLAPDGRAMYVGWQERAGVIAVIDVFSLP